VSDAVLTVDGVSSGYGHVPVLHDIAIEVREQELVAIIGANGAGKSTLLRTISGINRAWSGSIFLRSTNIARASSTRIARLGIAQVPEGRRVFAQHTVLDNLRLGGYVKRFSRDERAACLDDVFARFPVLDQRRNQLAGTLSGGEQQMLAIGMALMANPDVLLLDEPSLGLAPVVLDRVFEHIRSLREQGRAILLVEQLALKALEIADRAFVLRLGTVVASGSGRELLGDRQILRAYLGGGLT
jgi:ABC-type branched-subunit amino acid transport system ATPase component